MARGRVRRESADFAKTKAAPDTGAAQWLFNTDCHFWSVVLIYIRMIFLISSAV